LDPDSNGSGLGIRIRIQEGKNDPQKLKKIKKISCFDGCSLLRAEGFFCNLDVLYGGLGIGKLQFLIPKKLNFFSGVIFFQFLSLKPWIRIGTQPKSLKCWIRVN
jgi:hypothetical protein